MTVFSIILCTCLLIWPDTIIHLPPLYENLKTTFVISCSTSRQYCTKTTNVQGILQYTDRKIWLQQKVQQCITNSWKYWPEASQMISYLWLTRKLSHYAEMQVSNLAPGEINVSCRAFFKHLNSSEPKALQSFRRNSVGSGRWAPRTLLREICCSVILQSSSPPPPSCNE